MTDREFVVEVLRLDEKINGNLDFSYLVRELCERYKEKLAIAPVNTTRHTSGDICPECDGEKKRVYQGDGGPQTCWGCGGTGKRSTIA